MCVCIYICIQHTMTHTLTLTYKLEHKYISTHIHTHTQIYMYLHKYIYIYTYNHQRSTLQCTAPRTSLIVHDGVCVGTYDTSHRIDDIVSVFITAFSDHTARCTEVCDWTWLFFQVFDFSSSCVSRRNSRYVHGIYISICRTSLIDLGHLSLLWAHKGVPVRTSFLGKKISFSRYSKN